MLACPAATAGCIALCIYRRVCVAVVVRMRTKAPGDWLRSLVVGLYEIYAWIWRLLLVCGLMGRRVWNEECGWGWIQNWPAFWFVHARLGIMWQSRLGFFNHISGLQLDCCGHRGGIMPMMGLIRLRDMQSWLEYWLPQKKKLIWVDNCR